MILMGLIDGSSIGLMSLILLLVDKYFDGFGMIASFVLMSFE